MPDFAIMMLPGFRSRWMMPLSCASASAARICDAYASAVLTGRRLALQPGGDRLALHQFHHQVVRSDVVERADVGMVQRGNGACFPLEALNEPLLRRP